MTFAARNFTPRRGASDKRIPPPGRYHSGSATPSAEYVPTRERNSECRSGKQLLRFSPGRVSRLSEQSPKSGGPHASGRRRRRGRPRRSAAGPANKALLLVTNDAVTPGAHRRKSLLIFESHRVSKRVVIISSLLLPTIGLRLNWFLGRSRFTQRVSPRDLYRRKVIDLRRFWSCGEQGIMATRPAPPLSYHSSGT